MKKSMYVVGDVHGEHKKLLNMLTSIRNHTDRHQDDDPILVFVGDYVDRGPDSKAVLETVYNLTQSPGRFRDVVALKGNHEDMMILSEKYWDQQRIWFANGGIQTVESYGVSVNDFSTLDELVGPAVGDWLRKLPTYYVDGSVAVAHAGITHENLTAKEHTKEELLWDRSLRITPHDIYSFTVHGHTPMKRPLVNENVAYIDTGAVFGYKLSALYIPDVYNPAVGKQVIQVDADGIETILDA